MKDVIVVRIITLFAISAILSSMWIAYSPSENSVLSIDDESDDLALEAEYAADSDEDDGRGSSNREAEHSESPLSSGLLAGGIGIIGSLILGSFVLEFVKVAVLAALISPLVAGMKSSRDDMLTRGRILGYLEGNAGIHFSALRDGLGLANGVTSYHLHLLESRGEVISWRDGKLRRYAVSKLSKEEIGRIRNPIVGTRLAVLEILAKSGQFGLTGKEIQNKMSISRQLLSHHLRELRQSEMVETASNGRRPKWKVSEIGTNALSVSKEVSRARLTQ
jgi:predicted transcriptional regulator|tara:strand:- start:3273 stop:4103 length:831 start_codon:yes stop_codon:yes gene_type:complete